MDCWNAEHYYDPTAAAAIRRVMARETENADEDAVRGILFRPEELGQEIARKRTRAEALRRFATRLTAAPREVTVTSTPDPSRSQDLLAEAMDEEAQIPLLEEERGRALAEAGLLISRLPDPRLIRLLELRYLEGTGWDSIARTLGYAAGSVFRFHRHALARLAEILREDRGG